MSVKQFHDYSEFETKESPPDNILAKIAKLARAQHAAEKRVAKAEEELEAAKDVLRGINEHELPELMLAAQQEKLKTRDGIEVTLDEKVFAQIPKNDPERIDRCFAYVEKAGSGGAIKRTIVIDFDKGEEKWADKFERDCSRRVKPLRLKRTKTIHPGTLKAFITEQLANGEPVPIKDFGVHQRKFTKIKVT